MEKNKLNQLEAWIAKWNKGNMGGDFEEIGDFIETLLEHRIELKECAIDYIYAVNFMDTSMEHNINVHGAISQLVGATDNLNMALYGDFENDEMG